MQRDGAATGTVKVSKQPITRLHSHVLTCPSVQKKYIWLHSLHLSSQKSGKMSLQLKKLQQPTCFHFLVSLSWSIYLEMKTMTPSSPSISSTNQFHSFHWSLAAVHLRVPWNHFSKSHHLFWKRLLI